jgi:imidazolonepropionase
MSIHFGCESKADNAMTLTGSSLPTGIQVWRNCRLLTMAADSSLIDDGIVMARDGRIAFAGAAGAAPVFPNAEVIDLGGRLLTPAPIDCHTHLVHGGHRALEFEMRLAGATYVEIAKAGGGIASTVRATRALSVDELVAEALPRLDALLAEGLSTVEIKSGYGLTIETELRMLRAARQLATLRPVRIVTSYLGAHALPAEFAGRKADYIAEVVLPGLRAAHAEGLVDAVDGFCEGIAFDTEEIARVFDLAAELGLPTKLHAEQLSHMGGTRLAASRHALSADHLEYIDEADAEALARSGTVAVLLPGAFYAIREIQKPDVAALRRHGVNLAIATDCNPGTSPLTSLLLAMNMAATLFGLTVDECLAGVTANAARALGILDETGTIEAGKSADLAVWNCTTPAELAYRIGFNPLHSRIFKGQQA